VWKITNVADYLYFNTKGTVSGYFVASGLFIKGTVSGDGRGMLLYIFRKILKNAIASDEKNVILLKGQ